MCSVFSILATAISTKRCNLRMIVWWRDLQCELIPPFLNRSEVSPWTGPIQPHRDHDVQTGDGGRAEVRTVNNRYTI